MISVLLMVAIGSLVIKRAHIAISLAYGGPTLTLSLIFSFFAPLLPLYDISPLACFHLYFYTELVYYFKSKILSYEITISI